MPQIRLKGRFMTIKQLEKKKKQQSVGLSRKKYDVNEITKLKAEREKDIKSCPVQGCRIIDVAVFIQEMHCSFCDGKLLIHDIEEEFRKGLGSILKVRCANCLTLNDVRTGRVHKTASKEMFFDINSKAALGALHTGSGYTMMNKTFNLLEVPFMSSKTYKAHENKVGLAAEIVAKKSCLEAAKEERDLVIKNREALERILPEDLRSNFLIACTESEKYVDAVTDLSAEEKDDRNCSVRSFDGSENISSPKIVAEDTSMEIDVVEDVEMREPQKSFSRSTATEAAQSPPTQSKNVPRMSVKQLQNFIVRLLLAFDMGYSKRGNGRQYDSLNGYLAAIRLLTGKIVDFITRNRKCRMCDLGHPKSDHDRLNFYGSAKTMEANAALELATNSSILKEINAELGVFIGDNDSSSIHAIRQASDHPIVKHADKNHTSKGIKSSLYKIDKSNDSNNELNNESITYLHRCFTYALAQHKEDLRGLQAALRNIPYHAFNQHDNCEEWCGFVKDPKNYEHKTIPGGFTSEILFKELKKLFNDLADTAENFFAGGSSQANESLNALMARKCPKAICYSLGPSADYRFACAVGQKNLGESYVIEILKHLSILYGSILELNISRTALIHKQKIDKSKTIKYKARRRVLQKYRSQLKYRREKQEGSTYESNMCLFNTSLNQTHNNDVENSLELLKDPFTKEKYAVVIYDLETSGLAANCDILQITLKGGDTYLNEYIQPKQPIPLKVTEINGLSSIEGELFLRGEKVASSPLRIVLGKVLEFLKEFEKPCILVAHNGHVFDAPRFIRIIQECNLQSDFEEVIYAFADSLSIFKKLLPDLSKTANGYKLTNLASTLLKLPVDGAHDALFDIKLLEQLVFKYVDFQCLMDNKESYNDVVQARADSTKAKVIMLTLSPLEQVISRAMRSRLADAGITYQMLIDACEKGKDELVLLLKKFLKTRSI